MQSPYLYYLWLRREAQSWPEPLCQTVRQERTWFDMQKSYIIKRPMSWPLLRNILFSLVSDWNFQQALKVVPGVGYHRSGDLAKGLFYCLSFGYTLQEAVVDDPEILMEMLQRYHCRTRWNDQKASRISARTVRSFREWYMQQLEAAA